MNEIKENIIIPFKKFILKMIHFFHKNAIFKLYYLSKIPKIYTVNNYCEKKNDKLVIFSTYNENGIFNENLKFYINCLSKLDTDIVLVDTSPKHNEEECEKIKKNIRTYIWRENIGYDFGSWKVGLNTTSDWLDYDQIILANDSVIGPLYPLKEIFDTMNKSDSDIWGMTDSFEYSYHIMSYFLVFQKKVIKSEAFFRFWDRLLFYPNKFKKLLILEYEVGGSIYWLKNGFKLDSFIRYKDLLHKESEKKILNPTHYYWEILIRKFNFPFIKKDLFRKMISLHEKKKIVNVVSKSNEYKVEYLEI